MKYTLCLVVIRPQEHNSDCRRCCVYFCGLLSCAAAGSGADEADKNNVLCPTENQQE